MARSGGKTFRLASEGAEAVVRDFKNVGGAGEEMARKVKQGAGSMTPALRAADQAAKDFRKSAEDSAAKAGALGRALSAMGPTGVAAAAALGGTAAAMTLLSTSAKGAVDEMLALEGAARKSGVSTTFLQELREAAKATGQELGAIEPALSNFNVRLGEIRAGAYQGAVNDPLWAARALGFGPEAQDAAVSAEEAFMKVAEGLEAIEDAGERQNLADKLGVKDLLPLLEQGSAGLQKLRADAAAAGLVLSEEVVERGADIAKEWDRATNVIGAQLKQAALDVAPAFLELVKITADLVTNIFTTLDGFEAIENRQTRTLQKNYNEQLNRIRELDREFGQALYGPRPTQEARAQEVGPFGGFGAPTGSVAVPFATTQADRLVAAQNELEQIQRELDRLTTELRDRQNEAVARPVFRQPNRSLAPTGGGGPRPLSPEVVALNQERDSLKAWVAQLDAARIASDRFTAARALARDLTDDEVRAQLDLEDALNKLDRARELGIDLSYQQLEAIKTSQVAAFEDAIAQRRRAEALQRVAGLLEQSQTPLDVYNAQVADLAKLHAEGAISADQYATAMARASAQLESELNALLPPLVDAQSVFRERAGGLVDSALGELERAFRDGREVDGDTIRESAAQWWRDVLFDAFVAQPFDDLRQEAVGVLQTLTDQIFGGLKRTASGGKGVIGSIFDFGLSFSAPGVDELDASAKGASQTLKGQLAAQAAASAAALVSQSVAGQSAAASQATAAAAASASFADLARAAYSAAQALRATANAGGVNGPSSTGGGLDWLGIVSRFLGGGGGIPRFAAGGLSGPGWALVGEAGPELVRFGRPAEITPAAATLQRLSQAASGAAKPSQLVFAPTINAAVRSDQDLAALRAEMDAQRREFERWAAGEPERTVETVRQAQRYRVLD